MAREEVISWRKNVVEFRMIGERGNRGALTVEGSVQRRKEKDGRAHDGQSYFFLPTSLEANLEDFFPEDF